MEKLYQTVIKEGKSFLSEAEILQLKAKLKPNHLTNVLLEHPNISPQVQAHLRIVASESASSQM